MSQEATPSFGELIAPVYIPLLNPNEPDALLTALHVVEAQHVEKGDPLCTLETTKSAADLIAETSGYVLGLRFSPGQNAPAGVILCFLASNPQAQLPTATTFSDKEGKDLLDGLRITKPALALARKLVRQGVDALVVEGMEAGGHVGPVSTSVLAQEILPAVDEVPVFVAGGIGRGEAVLAYLEMGAAGCQLGTRFVCATESVAHPRFKQAFIRASARDAVTSVQLDPRFPVIPVRAIANRATQRFLEMQRRTIEAVDRGELDQKQAQLAIEHFWAGSLRRAAIEGDVEEGSLMAGQSVGMVQRTQSAKEIIDELVDQAAQYLK